MQKLIYNYRGLPRGMYVLFWAQVINRFGDFVMPFLALYLTEKMGVTESVAGIIVMMSSIITIPASMIGGKIADKVGRKKSFIYSQSIAAAALLPCAFTKNVYISIICLFISTFFNGFIRPAFSSMVADIVPKRQRQAGFALQYLGINIGVSIGPIIAGILFNNFLPMLFIGDAFTSFMAVILVWKNISETNPVMNQDISGRDENSKEKFEQGNVFQMLRKRPYICFFLVISGIYSFVYSQHTFALPITLKGMYGNSGAHLFGYLMSINAITVLLLTSIVTAVTKKNHSITNMVFAGVMYAVGFGMIAFINKNMIFLMLSTVIWTIGEILSTINSGVYVANNSPSNYRARLSAMSSVGWGIGSALSTSFSGAYMQRHGYKSIWTVTLAVALIASALMYIVKILTTKFEKRAKMEVDENLL
ncbi:MAG: MFS transporter [Clostridium sp.]|nr:MFS transporter [Clostridium sp.]